MTEHAFEIRQKMLKFHNVSSYHIYPDEQIFFKNPGGDRYVCASANMNKLLAWFGGYLRLFINEGGHIGIYEIPDEAVAWNDGNQVVYQQRQAILVQRRGRLVPDQSQIVEKFHPSKIL
jgi:hypothetical protein